MLSFNQPALYQASKCYMTWGAMPHLDPKQVPTKSKPWASLAAQDFVHRVDLVLPQEIFELVQQKLLRDRPAPTFQRVVMSLHDMLTGDFFTEYIKNGNILMLSEGRRGIDNVLYLRGGTLTMLLDKETYERAGLVGKPHGVKGKRGLRPRWIVEIDLTTPAMVKGKKGFDRLLYASKNALATPLTWLFCNLSSTAPNPDPLPQHSPTTFTCDPAITQNTEVLIPKLSVEADSESPDSQAHLEDYATELYEWLSLVRLQSPRVQVGDQIDPYLSRYRVPDGSSPEKVCKISWEGFLAPSWTRQMLVELILALPPTAWFAFSATTFTKSFAGDNSECTILRLPEGTGQYLMWEVKAHE